MEKTINQDGFYDEAIQIIFYGWTNYNNPKFKDFSDELLDNQEYVDDPESVLTGKDGKKITFRKCISKEGKEDYVKNIRDDYMPKAEAVLKNRCMIKGIKFNGGYHQNGDYGTPLFRVIDSRSGEVFDQIFKWSCTFRYWGGIMEAAGFGSSYMDWAWDDLEEPVYPDSIEGEHLVNN